jgi:hypothetical protein
MSPMAPLLPEPHLLLKFLLQLVNVLADTKVRVGLAMQHIPRTGIMLKAFRKISM